jgi:hypothetical protein
MISSTEHIKKTAHGLIVDRLLRIINMNVFDYVNPDGTRAFTDSTEVDGSVIKGIEQIPTRTGETRLKYTFHDPLAAMDMLKTFITIAEGYNIRAKIEIVDLKALDDAALRRMAEGKE